MLNKAGKSLCSLAVALLLMVSVCMTAFAAGAELDLSRKGSISVTLLESEGEHVPIPGGTFELHQVADIQITDSQLGYVPTQEYAGSRIDLNDLQADGLAEHLAAYTEQKQLVGIVLTADKAGRVRFENLKLGLYLVMQKGEISGYYKIAPFLVSIPMTDADGSSWLYDVDASPKTEIQKAPDPSDDFTKISVRKVWSDDGAHPQSIAVQLLKNGEVFDTAVLNDENGWEKEWTELEAGCRWNVVEKDVPQGYRVSYTEENNSIIITNTKEPEIPKDPTELTVIKVWEGEGIHPAAVTVELWNGTGLYDTAELSEQNGWTYRWTGLPQNAQWSLREIAVPEGYTVSYSVNGSTITVKNTKSEIPPKEDPPSLIQTGQLNWPVPVLAGVGILLLAAGWIMRKRYEE